MKKLTILAIPATAFSIGATTLAAAPVYAVSQTINQTVVDAALAGTSTNGLTCYEGDTPVVPPAAPNNCKLSAGDYELGSDIDFGNIPLIIDGGDFVIDLKNKTVTSSNNTLGTIAVRNAVAVIKNGKVTNLSTSPFPYAIASDDSNANITLTNITIGDNNALDLRQSTATLNDVTAPVTEVDGVDLTINGGTYGSDTTGKSGLCIEGDTSKITINGGTFTSASGSGVEIKNYSSAAINGGTFSGTTAGVSVSNYHDGLKIAGGTFRSTDGNAIYLPGVTDQSVLNNVFANGYTAGAVKLSAAGISIGGKETSVVKANENSTSSADSAKGTSSETSPKSGFMTSEGVSAVANIIPAAIAALVATVTSFAVKKKIFKKQS